MAMTQTHTDMEQHIQQADALTPCGSEQKKRQTDEEKTKQVAL